MGAGMAPLYLVVRYKISSEIVAFKNRLVNRSRASSRSKQELTLTTYSSAAILTMMCAYGVSPHITYTGSLGSLDIPSSSARLGTAIIR